MELLFVVVFFTLLTDRASTIPGVLSVSYAAESLLDRSHLLLLMFEVVPAIK